VHDSIAHIFLVRYMYMLSHVRLSVRHMGGSVITVEDRIMKFSVYSSPIPLVFPEINASPSP